MSILIIFAAFLKDEAKQKYIELVDTLLKEVGIAPSEGSTAAEREKCDNEKAVRWAKQDKVFRIELNRPDKFNAITWEMYEGKGKKNRNFKNRILLKLKITFRKIP